VFNCYTRQKETCYEGLSCRPVNMTYSECAAPLCKRGVISYCLDDKTKVACPGAVEYCGDSAQCATTQQGTVCQAQNTCGEYDDGKYICLSNSVAASCPSYVQEPCYSDEVCEPGVGCVTPADYGKYDNLYAIQGWEKK